MFKASKIICTGDEMHLKLEKNERVNIEVIEGT